ncbi:MAG: serine hydrolase domain-containing protein [Roseiflexaceae bacterium]|nr:serine hydrolase domain-containing protein [Roseiflexaceae bacterium]
MHQFRDQQALRQALEEQLGAARVPGIVVAAVQGNDPPSILALGVDADQQPLTATTLFPVASVTKLATSLAVLRLVDQGAMALDDQLAIHMPDAAAARAPITIRGLLSHTAGLPLDLPDAQVPYQLTLTWATLAEACLAIFPDRVPGERVQYSNVGYGLLALLVERIGGRAFAELLAESVLAPLGIEGFLGAEPPRPPARLADVRGSHAGSAIEPFNSPFWRSLALPWAGLVTNASGALALVRAFLGTPADFLNPLTRTEAIRNQTGDLGGGFVSPMAWQPCPWGLGPDVRGQKNPHWVPDGMPDSFGHSGASGCLAWADPLTNTAWVILGARVADNGWLLRRGPVLCRAILAAL